MTSHGSDVPPIEARANDWKRIAASVGVQQSVHQSGVEVQRQFLAALMDAADKAGFDLRKLVEHHSRATQAVFDAIVLTASIERPDLQPQPKAEALQ